MFTVRFQTGFTFGERRLIAAFSQGPNSLPPIEGLGNSPESMAEMIKQPEVADQKAAEAAGAERAVKAQEGIADKIGRLQQSVDMYTGLQQGAEGLDAGLVKPIDDLFAKVNTVANETGNDFPKDSLGRAAADAVRDYARAGSDMMDSASSALEGVAAAGRNGAEAASAELEAAKKEMPVEAPKPAVAEKPAEAPQPVVAEKPVEAPKPAVAEKLAEAPQPVVAEKPVEAPKPMTESMQADQPIEAEVTPEPADAPAPEVQKRTLGANPEITGAEAPDAAKTERSGEAVRTFTDAERTRILEGFRAQLTPEEGKMVESLREKALSTLNQQDLNTLNSMAERAAGDGSFAGVLKMADMKGQTPEEQRAIDNLRTFLNDLSPAERALLEKADRYVVGELQKLRNGPDAEASAEAAGEMSPEARQAKIAEIQGRMTAIDGELKDANITPERTQELQAEKAQLEADLKALTEGAEQQAKAPETKGEQLEQQMQQAMDKLTKAETPAQAFAAAMELLSTLIQYIQTTFDGTLSETLQRAEGANEEAGETPETKEDKEVKGRLEGELKERVPESEKDKALAAENIDGLRVEKSEELRKNAEQVAEITGDIDGLKKDNDRLIGERAVIERQINGLRGEENTEDLQRLQVKLDTLNKQIKANEEGIDGLDKQRDELAAKNKQLEKDIAALAEMKEDASSAPDRIGETVAYLNRVLKQKFPDANVPEFSVKDGKIIIKGVLTDEMKKLLPEGASIGADGTAEIPFSTLASSIDSTASASESADAKPSPNEIQQRYARVLESQGRSLVSSDLKIAKLGEGSAAAGTELGADYLYGATDFRIRYDAGAGQWQIRAEGAEQWQSPSQYVAEDPQNQEAARLLTVYNNELKGIQEQIAAAEKAA